MQRPKLTERTAEALGYAKNHLGAIYEDMFDESYSPEMRSDMKRAIEYLEDLLRWHRAKGREK
jgi:hypothetical protein